VKIRYFILPLVFFACISTGNVYSQGNNSIIRVDFCDIPVEFKFDKSQFIDFTSALSDESIKSFYENLSATNYQPIIKAIVSYKEKHKLDDWLFYQLVRRTAEHISPKAENYNRYTLYKWFLLAGSGYNTTISISSDKILFYVQSNDSIYNILCHFKDGRQ